MKNKNGFTLIELLAVIVILGIIMVIAVPAVTKYIDKSKKDSFVSTAKLYVDAAQKAVAAGEYTTPTTSTDTPLKILISKLDMKSGVNTSSYGQDYKDGSYILITSDDEGNLTYKITLIDEKNNAVMEKTLDELEKKGAENVVVASSDVTLPREYNVGDKVVLKENGGRYTVIEYASENALTIKLMSDKVTKANLSGYDLSCIGENTNCSSVKFADPPYGTTPIDLTSTTTDNIGWYIKNFETFLQGKYNDSTIKVELPSVETILKLAGINKSFSQLYSEKHGEDITKIMDEGINLGELNAKNLDIIDKEQSYWLSNGYEWKENGSTNTWRMYLRASYGSVINAYWANKNDGPGFRPVITAPASIVE